MYKLCVNPKTKVKTFSSYHFDLDLDHHRVKEGVSMEYGSIRPLLNNQPDNTTFNFLFNNYNYDHYPGMEMKYPAMETHPHMMVPGMMDKNGYGNILDKNKKKLSTEQLDSLERSFQEEIKLDPDRKMKLARELGLQPRQIAVWFQNRRARWKNKQLEQLYDSLKHDFDLVSREKLKLQDEVMKLKTILKEQAMKNRNPASTEYTDVSGEDTVESTSVALRSSIKARGSAIQHQIAECNYLFNVDEYNAVSSPFWGNQVLPSYP